MNELPTFKIRCSAIGTIMTAPRGKSMAEKIAELAGKIQTATERHDALKPGLKSKEALQGRILKMQEELASMLPYKDAPNLSASCISYLQLLNAVIERCRDPIVLIQQNPVFILQPFNSAVSRTIINKQMKVNSGLRVKTLPCPLSQFKAVVGYCDCCSSIVTGKQIGRAHV